MSIVRPPRRRRSAPRGAAAWAAGALLAVAGLLAPVTAAVAGTMWAPAPVAGDDAPHERRAEEPAHESAHEPAHESAHESAHERPRHGGTEGDGGSPAEDHAHDDPCSWCQLGRWTLAPAATGVLAPAPRAVAATAAVPSLAARAMPRTVRSRAPPVAA